MHDTRAHSRSRGNIFMAVFAGIAVMGLLGMAASTYIRGPMTASANLTRINTAQTQMILGAQMAITMSAQAASNGDCDGDGFIEPLRYDAPGANAHPTGGGLVPAQLAATKLDPWGTPYGYCVWDHGALTLQTGCQASGADRRLSGANLKTQPVLVFMSAGPDKTFQTSCNAWADANADLTPDTALVDKPNGSDDIIATYSYADASSVGGDLWELKNGDPTTATIAKDLDVAGGAQFDGNVVLGGGLVLSDETTSGACNVANENALRRNMSVNPPVVQVCINNAGTYEWDDVTGGSGGGAGPSTTLTYNTPTIIQTAPGSSVANGTSTQSISFSTAPTAGNAILVYVSGNGDGTSAFEMPVTNAVTDNQGNTYTLLSADRYSGNTYNQNNYVYMAHDIGAPSGTFTITVVHATGTDHSYVIGASEVSNLAASPLDQANPVANAYYNGPDVNVALLNDTAQPNELLIGIIANDADNLSPDATWTTRYDTNFVWTPNFIVQSKVLATPGPASISWPGTVAVNGIFYPHILALKGTTTGGSSGNGSSGVTYVGSASSVSSGTVSYFTQAPPAGIQPGDLLIWEINIQHGYPNLHCYGEGWVKVANRSTSTGNSYYLYRIVGASDPTVYDMTTGSSQRVVSNMVAYRGADPKNPLVDFDTYSNSNPGSSPYNGTAMSVDPSTTNSTLVYLLSYTGCGVTSYTHTPPTGFTSRSTVDNGGQDYCMTGSTISERVVVSDGPTGNIASTETFTAPGGMEFRGGLFAIRGVSTTGPMIKVSTYDDIEMQNGCNSAIDLTALGADDWVTWAANAWPLERKSGTAQITDPVAVGSQPYYWENGDPIRYSWTDAAVTTTGNANGSMWVPGNGNGYSLTFPADTTRRVARIYGYRWQANVRITASLSDSSATTVIDNTMFNPNVDGDIAFYTDIEYSAASAGQTLTVTATSNGGSDPYASFSAAALFTAPTVGGGGVAATDGEVFFNDGGNMGVDSTFIWDKTNDRLGLTTASPFGTLDLGIGTGQKLLTYSDNSNGRIGMGTNMGTTSGGVPAIIQTKNDETNVYDNNNAGAASATTSFNSLPSAGNSVLVIIGVGGDGGGGNSGNIPANGVTDNQGNTYTKIATGPDPGPWAYRQFVFIATGIGTPTGTFTVTVDPDVPAMANWNTTLLEISNLASNPFDQTAAAAHGWNTTGTLTATTPATTQASELAIAIGGFSDTSTVTIESGWTESARGIYFVTASKILSTTGTVSHAWGWTSGDQPTDALILTLKGGGSAGSTNETTLFSSDQNAATGPTGIGSMGPITLGRRTAMIHADNVDSSSGSFTSQPRQGSTIIVTVAGLKASSGTFSLPAGTVTDNQGNTYNLVQEAPNTTGGARAYIYAAYNIAAPSGTFTITTNPTGTGSAEKWEWGATEVIGLTASSLDQTGSTSDNTQGNLTNFAVSTTGATTQAHELAIAVVAGDNGSSSTDPVIQSNWTWLHTNSEGITTVGHSSVYKVLNGAGTVSHTWANIDAYNTGASAAIATFRGITSATAGGGAGTPAVVQTSAITGYYANPATETVSFSTPPTAGNTIILAISEANGCGGNSTIPEIYDNQGNTYNFIGYGGDSSVGNDHKSMLFAASDIAAPSGTFTISMFTRPNGCLSGSFGAIEVSGLGSYLSIDQTTTSTSAPNVTMTSGATTQANELALALHTSGYDSCGNENYVTPTGWTSQILANPGGDGNNPYTRMQLVSKSLAATGAQSVTWNLPNGCSNWFTSASALLATLKSTETYDAAAEFMTPAVEQNTGWHQDGYGTPVSTLSASLTSLPDAGNAILVFASFTGVDEAAGILARSGSVVTDNQGNSYTLVKYGTSARTNDIHSYIFMAKNIGTPTGTFTITLDTGAYPGRLSFYAMELSGVDADPLDVSGTGANGYTDTNTVTATAEVSQPNEVAFAMQTRIFDYTSYTATSGWSTVSDVHAAYYPASSIMQRGISAMETPSITWTEAVTQDMDAVLITLKAKAVNAGSGGAAVDPGSISMGFVSTGDGTTYTERLRIKETGKIGMGTTSPAALLSLTGEAILGDSSLTCATGTKGSIRYNSTVKKLQICSGTSWGNVNVENSTIPACISSSGGGGGGSSGITFRSSASTSDGAGSGSTMTVTQNVPAGVQAGDLLIWGLSSDGNTMPPPSGWTLLFNGVSTRDGQDFNVFYRVADGSEGASYTTSATSYGYASTMVAYSGVDTTTPIEAYNSAADNNSEYTSVPVSTTSLSANAMLVHLVAYDQTSTGPVTYTAPTGFTHVATGTDDIWDTVFVSEQLQPAAGATGSISGTASGPGNAGSIAGVLALKPAAAVTLTAPTYVGAATAANSTYPDITQTVPGGIVANDLLVWVISNDSSNGYIQWPAGWTPVTRESTHAGDSAHISAAYKFATASEPATYTANMQDGAASLSQMVAYRGVDTTSPIADATTGHNNTNTASPWTTPALSVSPMDSNSLLVYIASVDPNSSGSMVSSPNPYTSPSGFTSRSYAWESTWNTFEISDKVQASAGPSPSYSATVTGSNQAGKSGMLFALRPSGAVNTSTAYYKGSSVTGYESDIGTVVQPIPSMTSTDDLMLWVLETDNGQTPTWPSGWTQIETENSAVDGGSIFVAYKLAAGEPASYTMTIGADAYLSQIIVYGNVNTSTPIATSVSAVDGAGSLPPWTIPATSLTTTSANTRLVHIASLDMASANENVVYTKPTGFQPHSSYTDGTWNSIYVSDKLQSAAGATGSITTTATTVGSTGGSAGKFGILVAINSGSSGGGGSGTPCGGTLYNAGNSGATYATPTVVEPTGDARANATSLTVPLSTAPTAGDTIVVALTGNMTSADMATATVTDTMGNTYHQVTNAHTGGYAGAYIYAAYNVAATAGWVTATLPTTVRIEMTIVTVTGVEAAPLDAVGSVDHTVNGNVQTHVTSTSTATTQPGIAITFTPYTTNPGTITDNSSYNNMYAPRVANYPYYNYQYKLYTNSAIQTHSETISGAAQNANAAIIALKAKMTAPAPADSFNASTMYFDEDTGYVGVNRTTPGVALDLSGALRVANDATACSSSLKGSIRYNTSTDKLEFCNGTAWNPVVAPDYSGTAATYSGFGTGYFVLTSAAYNGNRGGLAGANATCLTDLTANNWTGKTTANTNGWLVASNVKAWLCDQYAQCNNFLPNTTYRFARSGDTTSTGTSFTANASGVGFGNTTAWNGAGYFNLANTNYWTGRLAGTSTYSSDAGSGNTCGSWTSASSGQTGDRGNTSQTGINRWAQGSTACNTTTRRMICIVHPQTP